MPFQAARESDRFLRGIRRRLLSGYEPSLAEVVEVPKWGGGTRPATEMAVDDRLVYDSLIAHLRGRTVAGLVNESPTREERAGLEARLVDGEHTYVLVADIASFYEYVQHVTLLSELLDLTGEAEAVEALGELLAGVMGAHIGLPQGPPSSGFLADVYASIADRRLQRAGHRVTRFSDDYRVPADSWHGAIAVQVKLERALRTVGLIVNSAKTRTPSRELYAQWIADRGGTEEPHDVELENGAQQAVNQDPETDEAAEVQFWPPYLDYEPGDEQLPLDQPHHEVTGEYQAIIADPGYWGDRENTERTYRLVGRLYQVAAYDTTDLTEGLPVLLERFPHLARETSLSLRRRMGTAREGEAMVAINDALRDRQYLFPWQRGWLFHALIPADGKFPPELVEIARTEFLDGETPWFSRARAAIALATENLLELDDTFRAVYEAAPTATRVDLLAVAAALARSGDQASTAFVAAEARGPHLEGISGVINRWQPRVW